MFSSNLSSLQMPYDSEFAQLSGSIEIKYALTLVSTAIFVLFCSLKWLKASPFRLVNGKKFGDFTNVRVKKEFMFGARQLIAKGLALSPGLPFRIMADVGEVLILPPKYAYEIRNHDQLSFTKAAFKVSREKISLTQLYINSGSGSTLISPVLMDSEKGLRKVIS